ncbi:MAG: LysM peptidoglycan-binding domain-containing protein [Alicyclobacillus sp.]|nr:LysM peptidoglycan-binding domain-containing protein [Alicyclobacillus sp.]
MKTYVVKPGDTLWKISQATGVRLNQLLAANPHIKDPHQLRPGEILVIPDTTASADTVGQMAAAPAPPPAGGPTSPAPPAAPEPPPMGEIPPYFGFVWPHVVQPGETWESIARQYGVSIQQLRQLNPMHGPMLQAGDLLYVPGPAGGPAEAGVVSAGPAEPVPVPGGKETGAPVFPAGGTAGMVAEPGPGTPAAPPGSSLTPPAQGPSTTPPAPGGWVGPPGPHTHYPFRRLPWMAGWLGSWGGYPAAGWRHGWGWPGGPWLPWLPLWSWGGPWWIHGGWPGFAESGWGSSWREAVDDSSWLESSGTPVRLAGEGDEDGSSAVTADA